MAVQMKLSTEAKFGAVLVALFMLGNVDKLFASAESREAKFPAQTASRALGLNFKDTRPAQETAKVDYHGKIFDGGNKSLVAVAVGSAEGTRTPNSDYTKAYSGHSDPGNGVWNLGSFSYQHGAASPEEADVKQLKRLKTQYEQILWWAQEFKVPEFTLEEALNAVDLANQSPAAAINDGGYSLRMAEAIQKGLTGYDRILYARTASFVNPNTGRLDAPGLGNTWDRVVADQARRMDMIRATMDTYATF
jgi:hypothetical protein